MTQDSPDIYFEKQGTLSLQCGRHSVNNILGKSTYDSSQMNEICYQLSKEIINPHKHVFGGDYDVNVLINALQNNGCFVKWYDRRNRPFKIREEQEEGQLVGFLVNKYMGSGILNKILRMSPRHWFCVRYYNNKYYFLDSKQDNPLSFDKQTTQTQLNRLINIQNDEHQYNQVIEVYRKRK